MKPFDTTKPCQTRDGRKVRIICTDSKYIFGNCVPQPIVAEVGDSFDVWHFSLDGTFDPDCKVGPSDLINIPEKRKMTGWVNVYPDGAGVILKTKSECDRNAAGDRIACLDLSKYNIEFEEGDGILPL